MKVEYAIIIRNKTRLESLTERFNTRAQAKFYIEHSGGDFSDYESEHEKFQASFSAVLSNVGAQLKYKVVERNFLPSYIFREDQVVITVGQDGLVANTAKYVNGVPLIAVNPDAERFDGVLLPFTPDTVTEGVEKVKSGKFRFRVASFAEAKLNDGQRLLAFNDLFVGAASHVSARYKISYSGKEEVHSSSGIIISTPAGSTGWMSSIFNMSFGIQEFIGHEHQKRMIAKLKEEQLLFAVREPFRSKKSQAGIVAGVLTKNQPLLLESFMPGNGIIFSDGMETDFLRFNSGSLASIGLANEKVKLVLPDEG